MGEPISISLAKDSYLLELSRYIVLNPVPARMTRSVNNWPSSSYRAVCSLVVPPDWLSTNWLLSTFGKTRKTSVERYWTFVAQGKNLPSPWEELKNQIFLGDEQVVEDMQYKPNRNQELSEISRIQRRKAPKLLDYYSSLFRERNEGIVTAY
jgi:putative transposase